MGPTTGGRLSEHKELACRSRGADLAPSTVSFKGARLVGGKSTAQHPSLAHKQLEGKPPKDVLYHSESSALGSFRRLLDRLSFFPSRKEADFFLFVLAASGQSSGRQLVVGRGFVSVRLLQRAPAGLLLSFCVAATYVKLKNLLGG